jgi:hypothetical protein
MFTQPLPNVEDLSFAVMGSASYHSVLLEKIPTQLEEGRDYLGCNINGILSKVGSFRAE